MWRAIGLALLLLAAPARAAFDAYLLLPGIPGEATEPNHLNWMQILSFEHSESSVSNTVQFSGLTLVKPVDKATSPLMTACARGQRLANGRLQLVHLDARRLVFYDLQLTNVIVTALASAGASGTNPPLETLSLSFSEITWTYTAFAPSGLPGDMVRAYWDLVLLRGGSSIIPAFRIEGIQRGGSSVKVSWNGVAGKTYKLFASPLVEGTYSLAGQTTVSTDGPASLTISSAAPIQFYTMEQLP